MLARKKFKLSKPGINNQDCAVACKGFNTNVLQASELFFFEIYFSTNSNCIYDEIQ